MAQICKCIGCGREYEVSAGAFDPWLNTEFCKKCFNDGLITKKNGTNSNQQTIIKTYIGNQEQATAAFRKDIPRMQAKGYFPISQTWAPGSYGCGAFLLALLLCVIIIGILVFIYMIIVKPVGTLSVTYEFRKISEGSDEKTCPKCAETIKAAAIVCRFCGHNFE